jgi:DNA-binding MarR family transcriptional regulator
MNPVSSESQSQSQIQGCYPPELATCQVLVLGKLGYAIKRRAIEALEADGASLYDFSVLGVLARGACEGQNALADILQLDRSQLVGLLDGLEERGLIERRRDPSDRRRHTVSLTDAGAQEFERVRGIVKQIEADFLEPLSKEERKTLYELALRALAHHDVRFDIGSEIKLAS